ncbi:MAG: response regulator [Pyrinomonadaceae bacterium]
MRVTGLCVLIVESDRAIRELLGELFTLLRQEATSVSDASSALNLLEHGRFDLMLVDYSLAESAGVTLPSDFLPNDKGLVLARISRQGDPNLKIIMLAGSAEDALITAMRNGTVDAIIRKPFSISDVESVLVDLAASEPSSLPSVPRTLTLWNWME